MVRVVPTTRYGAVGALAAIAFGLVLSTDPEARQGATVTADQRREAIVRMWRDAKPAPVPIGEAEDAWTLTLPTTPSAAGTMDDRHVYIPLREALLVALDRETGRLRWSRPIDVTSPVVVGNDSVFAVSQGTIRALDAATGEDRWSVPLDAVVTAPLVWDSGWLIAIVEPGEVLAFRAADGALIWRRTVRAPSIHAAAAGGRNALYFSLNDGRLVALGLERGEPLWEQTIGGTLSPPAVARDRVFVGSTDNFLYAFNDETGRLQWKWRNGGDVIGAAVDVDVVYFASLDNVIRAVNRGNGNQRWMKPTGTRPILPPRAFGGVVVLPGLTPALTVFVGDTGEIMGTHAVDGNLVGEPVVDDAPKPFRVAIIVISREGAVTALRPADLMFREARLVPLNALPGRAILRERLP